MRSRLQRGWIAFALVMVTLAGCVRESFAVHPRLDRVRAEPGGRTSQFAPPRDRGATHATGPRRQEAGPGWVESSRAEKRQRTNDSLESQSLEWSESFDETLVSGPGATLPRFEWNLIRNPDGTLTKLYYFRSNKPGIQTYVDLLKRFVPDFASLQEGSDYWVQKDYIRDPRKKNEDRWFGNGEFALPFGAGEVADLLMVSASEMALRQIDSFLAALRSQTPQVEVEVTIVEIDHRDGLTVGFNLSATREGQNNLFNDVSLNLAQDLVTGTFGSFSAIHDETVINGMLEVLQETGYSNILSSPKLAVLNGHRAVIDTGAETPVFTPEFNANGLNTISTEFRPTGIKVVVVPFILSGDTVQLDISVEVSSVTGTISSAVGGSATVDNPLLSRRNAHTMVTVPSGKTVLIGGLITSSEVETVDKIPLLGDIPLLGKLFQRRSSTIEDAQVLFLVKPKVFQDRFEFGDFSEPIRALTQ